jgi:hypothetical protein
LGRGALYRQSPISVLELELVCILRTCLEIRNPKHEIRNKFKIRMFEMWAAA